MDLTNNYSLIRLFDAEPIINHIMSLNDDDRYLRFGYMPSNDMIRSYVNKSITGTNTKTKADFWFGIATQHSELVATAHIVVRDDVAEFAFTTDDKYRGKKLGQLLFARGYQLVVEYQVKNIYLCMLSKNKSMQHIAKKFGMSVLTEGTDSEASVNISYPVPLSRLDEVKMSCIDKNLFERK
jgi:hypothetical protein